MRFRRLIGAGALFASFAVSFGYKAMTCAAPSAGGPICDVGAGLPGHSWRHQAASTVKLALHAPSARADNSGWREFTSDKYRFSVQYPASWHRLPGASDILDITNFERSGPQDGIGSRVAGAEITVTGALPGVTSVDDWIRHDLPDSDDIAASESDLKIPQSGPYGCTKLKQAAWREPLSPDAAFAQTSYYCTTTVGLFKASLLNWQSDPRQEDLRQLALKIILSLRTR